MRTSISSKSSNRAAASNSHLADTRGQLIVPLESLPTTLKPTLRSRSCSACSIIRKKATKWTIPAASVSLNSTRRVVTKAVDMKSRLLAHVRQQRHVPRPLDRQGDGVLADRGAAALAAADDLAVAVDELLEQFDVLVIDEHRPGPDAIHPNRVLLLGLELGLGPLPRLGVFLSESGGEGHVRAVRKRWCCRGQKGAAACRIDDFRALATERKAPAATPALRRPAGRGSWA